SASVRSRGDGRGRAGTGAFLGRAAVAGAVRGGFRGVLASRGNPSLRPGGPPPGAGGRGGGEGSMAGAGAVDGPGGGRGAAVDRGGGGVAGGGGGRWQGG